MAAGTLLVEEAGGRISDMRGRPHSVTGSDHLLADNGGLHDEVLAFFGEIFAGRFPVEMPAIAPQHR
jgi:myo-inositol-1(or 4)-monophosphatase